MVEAILYPLESLHKLSHLGVARQNDKRAICGTFIIDLIVGHEYRRMI
jgi:hypothetical protein